MDPSAVLYLFSSSSWYIFTVNLYSSNWSLLSDNIFLCFDSVENKWTLNLKIKLSLFYKKTTRPSAMQRPPATTTAVASASTLKSASTPNTTSSAPIWGRTSWRNHVSSSRLRRRGITTSSISCVHPAISLSWLHSNWVWTQGFLGFC